MLDFAISLVGSNLNSHLRQKFQLTEDKLTISGLVGQDGAIAVNEENKLILSLLNVENEPASGSSVEYRIQGNRATKLRQSIHVNVYFLVAAHFASENYDEALKYVSETISYFQVNNYFDKGNTEDMPANLEKLIVEMCRWKIQETSQMWHMIGAKFLPSVAYKMRLLSYVDDQTLESTPVAESVDVGSQHTFQ